MISVIIPVYNNWELTEQCLRSLALFQGEDRLEVIVIDNASRDLTPTCCQALGEQLFPNHFSYLRQEINRNYSGANNIGVRAAQGEFILLLNNDTIITSEWVEPLLSAFKKNAHLGAVGPLLLYPGLKKRVQHVGVTVSLGGQLSHIYEYFPYPHPLLFKKRDLQVITGAALFMPKKLYLALGGLDERFINGFEDVEFCTRLRLKGYQLEVVPKAIIYHYGSQSIGRTLAENQNSSLCKKLCADFLQLDEAKLFREDGYEPKLSPWLTLEARPREEIVVELESKYKRVEELIVAIECEPYWLDGLINLAQMQESQGKLKDAFDTWMLASRFCGTPEVLIPFASFLARQKQKEDLSNLKAVLTEFVTDPDTRLRELNKIEDELEENDERELLASAGEFKKNLSQFFKQEHATLLKALKLTISQ